jgi:hypothetical protein
VLDVRPDDFASVPTHPWIYDAACAGMRTAIFFPRGRASWDVPRRICATCPVSAPCLDYALAMERGLSYRGGMYGGKTPAERAELVQRRSA